MFSLKTDTVMQSSKLGYQTWAIAICVGGKTSHAIRRQALRGDLINIGT